MTFLLMSETDLRWTFLLMTFLLININQIVFDVNYLFYIHQ